MSKALRCDRCGKAFSPILMSVTDQITTIPEMHFQNRDNYRNNTVFDRRTDINFCNDCTNDFLKFMEDFSNETNHLSGLLSFAERSDPYLDADEYIRGRHEHGGASGDCDGKAAEREDQPK